MKVVVCIKQVPDTKGGVKFNPDGTLDRAAMMTIMNPDDKAGLEAALRLKDQYGAEVTVLTMGLPKADDVLREAMAMGADKAILVTDRVLGGADTWATSSRPFTDPTMPSAQGSSPLPTTTSGAYTNASTPTPLSDPSAR